MNSKQLVSSFCAKWRKKYGVSYYPNWARDVKMMNMMLENSGGWEEIEAAIDIYLTRLDDQFLEDAGFPISLIPSSMPRIAVIMAKDKKAAEVAKKSTEHPDLADVLNIRKKLANGDETGNIDE